MKVYLSLLLALATLPIFGQFLERESSSTLAPSEPPRESIFGIAFSSPPAEVQVHMQRNDTSLLRSMNMPEDMIYQVYKGTPAFAVPGVRSYMKFFDDKLISMSFRFQPSFKSYLILKDQLLKDLGARFKIGKQGLIDPFIKASLLDISDEGITKELESEIVQSILDGSSVFYVPIEDSAKKVNISLYWTRSTNPHETILGITYSSKKGEGALKKMKDAKDVNRSLLPQ